MRVLFVIAVIFLTTGQASAQDERPFLREGPIGRAESDLVCDAGERDPYPVACWLGEEVVFLPAERGTVTSYAEAEFVRRAGSVADVISVDETRDGVYEIVLKDRADGAELKRRVWKDRYSLDGVALVRDIEAARSRYIGDSLFTTDRIAELNTYDPEVHRLRSFDVDPGQSVLVEDIVVGWDAENPLRVIVRTAEGKEGFVDVAWRSTRNYSGDVVDNHLFEHYFAPAPPILELSEFPGQRHDPALPYQLEELDREAVYAPIPSYSEQVNAIVRVRITVDPQGRVIQRIPLTKTNLSLEKSVMDALARWRFDPLPSNVRQENQVGTITFEFRLE